MAYAKKPPPKNTKAYEEKRLANIMENNRKMQGMPERPTKREDPSNKYNMVTQQIIDDICLHIANFGEPMEVVCLRKGMPEVSTVRKYCDRHPEAKEQIENARVGGVYTLACNLRKVARGESGYSSKDVNRDKLIVETELKVLRAIAPKEFGDKQQVDMNVKAQVIPNLDITPEQAYLEMLNVTPK